MASTGENNRWTTGLARSVDVAERSRAAGLHSDTLPVLTEPLNVFGDGVFSCDIRADVADATVHVYVESIDPEGRVRILTEGMQRLRPPATTSELPGDTTHRGVTIRLRPVAFALPAGWRLRLSLAGEDLPTFERMPALGRVTWSARHNGCALVLPVIAHTVR
jgi:predicted acyl esterase